jgi:N-acetylmuramoyl-L-alanine amidase
MRATRPVRRVLGAAIICTLLVAHLWQDHRTVERLDTRVAELERARELDCLARNVYWEARSEGEKGQRAVAWVTLNRVAHPHYPKTVCGVVGQARVDSQGRPLRNQCQFSWFCDGKPDDPRDASAWARAQQVAWEVMGKRDRGETQKDPTKGAVFYHATWMEQSPAWAETRKPTVQLGLHQFYK